MEIIEGENTFHANSTSDWRKWLEENHHSTKSIWSIIYKKESATPSVYYPEEVDEALCFGCVDSKPNKRNEQSYYQYFSARNPKSNWSKVNKEKVARLSQMGKLAPAGLEMIRLAKGTGTWDALNEVDALILPPDLESAFREKPIAFAFWKSFPPSTRRGILEWIFNAKRAETRANRIAQTVDSASQNERANSFSRKK